jgi:hypothetical protein
MNHIQCCFDSIVRVLHEIKTAMLKSLPSYLSTSKNINGRCKLVNNYENIKDLSGKSIVSYFCCVLVSIVSGTMSLDCFLYTDNLSIMGSLLVIWVAMEFDSYPINVYDHWIIEFQRIKLNLATKE